MSHLPKLSKTAPLRVAKFFGEVWDEYRAATEKHGLFHSAHEGWAVLYEEVDELWEEVRKKRANRNADDMYRECVQIAAMALKFAVSICRPKEPKEIP